jgi:GNAT superfamily N-acetyltransferase
MDAARITIRPIVEADWAEYRDLRFRMLEEIPLAFGERLATARLVPTSVWRARTRRAESGNAVRFVAIDTTTGAWVGTMGGFLSPDDGNRAVLVGVYVVPGYRGSDHGVTDRLLALVEEWARRFGNSLLLHVHEQNPRAIAAYAKRGFVPTGVTLPYPLDTSQTEIEMSKQLRRSSSLRS